jgi:hypothetical protein
MPVERRLAIMQPYFFPYLGYFQLMAKVDTFVLYDDVNFINRGWINRNRINLNGEPHLVTVPLKQASQNRLIYDIELGDDATWRAKLIKTLRQAYARAPQFERVMPLIDEIVLHSARNLADYLLHSLTRLRDHLGLDTHIVGSSRRYENASLKAQERIIDICLRERTDIYINSIGGLELYSPHNFDEARLKLQFLTPSLPAYTQCGSEFVAGLSIIDVLMCNDEASVKQMLQGGTLS